MANSRQAVVLIHGIGEQRPMENLRAFVDAVWTRDKSLHDGGQKTGGRVVWSKPDFVSESFELRRLTTIANRAGRHTDFFELYWAHLMPGHLWRHITGWAWLLLRRSPASMSPQTVPLWLLVWACCLLTVCVAVATLVLDDTNELSPWLTGSAAAVGGALTWFAASRFLIDRLGDAARYLDCAPPNIEHRHRIRSLGVDFIERLHREKNEDGTLEYDRIVLVGHSLGSVIGYDILTHAWGRHARLIAKQRTTAALDAFDRWARDDPQSTEFRSAQDAYRKELCSQGIDWRVSDFVTLGSPLAHAEFLLSSGKDDFARRKRDRELPLCPPEREKESCAYTKDGKRVPNHAAVFAPTRWSNLYFPARLFAWGDLIGGPLRGVLGNGINDVAVRTRKWFGLFSHTRYWRPDGCECAPGEQITALREVLRLGDESAAVGAEARR